MTYEGCCAAHCLQYERQLCVGMANELGPNCYPLTYFCWCPARRSSPERRVRYDLRGIVVEIVPRSHRTAKHQRNMTNPARGIPKRQQSSGYSVISLVSDISQWEEPLAKPVPYAAFTRGTTGSQPLLRCASGALGKAATSQPRVPDSTFESRSGGRWAVAVGLLCRRGAACCRRGAARGRRGATCWRAVFVLGVALLVTALRAALLITGFAGLLLRPGSLAVVPPIITAIPPGGLRVRRGCDHHASACEKR